MRCPDRDTIARLLDRDREGLAVNRELSAHVRNCARCQRVVSEDGELRVLLRMFFKQRMEKAVRETVPCPSPEELAEYVEGKGQIYRRKQLLQHFCACPRCARAVLDISRTPRERAPVLPAELVREARRIYGEEGKSKII